MASDTTVEDIAYLTELVREYDRPRYYATLFAPAALRADLFAIYGFAAEIARIPDQVSEPQLGEIRLMWWQEALATAAYAAEVGASPAVRALSGVISRRAFPLAPFEALIESRRADFYSDPPATLTDLEGQMGETESVLFQIAAITCGAGSDTAGAAGHAGVAYGIARRLSILASDRMRGRTILPADLLAKDAISASDAFAPSDELGLHRTVAALAAVARRHLGEARQRIAAIPASARPVFLPLAVVGPLLRKIERVGPAIVERDVGLSNLERLTRIGLARLRGN